MYVNTVDILNKNLIIINLFLNYVVLLKSVLILLFYNVDYNSVVSVICISFMRAHDS